MRPGPIAPPLLEKDVARQIRDFLEVRGWRIVRNNVTKIQFRPGVWTQFGEKGMPDLLAIRYLHANGVSIVAWIETKRQRGGQLGIDQIKWRDIEQKLGAVVLLSNDFDAFLAEYEARFSWLHKPPYSVPGHQGRLELT